MRIHFTMTVHNFEDAATMEKTLKKNDIKYTTRVEDKPSLGSGRIKRNAPQRIDKAQLAAVVQAIASHPEWSWVDIGKSCGVNDQAVGKIARGVHSLQKGQKGNSKLHDVVNVL